MGDRALIQFKDSDGRVGPVVYLHWHGSSVRQLLDETRLIMTGRQDDLAYVTARFIGVCHTHIDPPLSLGTWNQPLELSAEHSHGGAGIFVVECFGDWNVKTGGGYGFNTLT